MKRKYLVLISQARAEMSEIDHTINRVQQAWERFKKSGDDFYLDSVALNLHSFYTAIEKIFEMIADVVDQSRPSGENWHKALLQQMASEIKLVRPPVISRGTRDELDDYRGFRHVVRNVYAFRLAPTKIAPLVEGLSDLYERFGRELEGFLGFLEATSLGNCQDDNRK
jgi:uncharacterized protein YutE (UPF0331/DUF86 family)